MKFLANSYQDIRREYFYTKVENKKKLLKVKNAYSKKYNSYDVFGHLGTHRR